MKKVYQANNALEAHMVADLLRQQHIEAHIEGQYLTGAMGELPASGLVQVVVAQTDLPRAQEIIRQWENTQPAATASAAPVPPTPSKPGLPWRAASAGFLLAAGMCWLSWRAPLHSEGLDLNHDGKLDSVITRNLNGLAIKQEDDRNFDGKIDYIAFFNTDGSLASAQFDDDFDGIFESSAFYTDGQLSHIDTDTDGDGFIDMKARYRHEVLTQIEYIDRNFGYPARVEYFRLGKRSHAELDTDQDGKLDTRIHYNDRLEEKTREPIGKGE